MIKIGILNGVDYSDDYFVNENGEVFSNAKTWKCAKGGMRHKQITKMKPEVTTNGYLKVKLCKNGIQKGYYIHRIIASCLIENPNNLPVINHIDGNKQNNHISNLEWCTQSENIRHSWDKGLSVAYVRTDYHKEKSSLLHKGKQFTFKTLNKMQNAKNKCVTNETGQIYKSSKFAALLFGGNPRAVASSIKNKCRFANHTWQYI